MEGSLRIENVFDPNDTGDPQTVKEALHDGEPGFCGLQTD